MSCARKLKQLHVVAGDSARRERAGDVVNEVQGPDPGEKIGEAEELTRDGLVVGRNQAEDQ